jgi:hypothetical protein
MIRNTSNASSSGLLAIISLMSAICRVLSMEPRKEAKCEAASREKLLLEMRMAMGSVTVHWESKACRGNQRQ